MNCEGTTGLLSDRLKGLLTGDDERRLEAHLERCPACREEAEAVGALWAEMGALDDDVPHERMRARFHAALAAYEQADRASFVDRAIERVWPRRPALQAAVALVLLGVGVGVGRELPSPAQAEIAGLRRDIRSVSLALLDHQSPSERLLGVEWSRRAESYTPVTEALLETVRNDANVNVRLAAVEALSDSLDRPEVAAGLTDALGRQQAPLVQVTLANTLLEGKVDGAVAAVERLIDRDGIDPLVRDYLRAALREADDSAAPGDLL
jgi:anti-sigma factor RsiW